MKSSFSKVCSLVLSLICSVAIADEDAMAGEELFVPTRTLEISPESEINYCLWMREEWSGFPLNGFTFICSFPLQLSSAKFISARFMEIEDCHRNACGFEAIGGHPIRDKSKRVCSIDVSVSIHGDVFGECKFYCQSNITSRSYLVLRYSDSPFSLQTPLDNDCDFYVFPLASYVSVQPFTKVSSALFSNDANISLAVSFDNSFSLGDLYKTEEIQHWSAKESATLDALSKAKSTENDPEALFQINLLEQKLRRVFKIRSERARGSVHVEPSEFDFGERTEIERPVLTATLRNDGDRTVHVTDVIRTCVCANLELSATNLLPGGSAEVRCTLDPNVFSGPFLKTFFIKTDDPATPSITVPIRGSVRELWKVEPDKWHQMRVGDTNAVLRVKAAPDAPALVRTEILGPDGASFELRPVGEREFDAVFAPGDQPRGQHHWTVNLYPEGAETPALGLHLGKQVGEHWKCVPARLRAPVNGRDFVADLLVKPADGKDLPADVDPAAITISPVWDHVSIEPLGPPTWRGIPLRLTVGAEMVSSWEFPKTFYLTIPGHGVASVYFEKIVPATEPETEQTGETK